MTNNSQLVGVPRELLERLLAVYSSSTWPAWHELARALESTPAEDVRAVAEEPVGYASDEQLKRMAKGHTETLSLCAKRSHLIDPVALYRHPQRPVLSPERKEIPVEYAYRKGWNACLDAVEDLNK